MKKVKKILSFLLAFALLLGAVPVTSPLISHAAQSGYCGSAPGGTNLRYTLDDEGVLTIGVASDHVTSGAMKNWQSNNSLFGNMQGILTVVIEEGVTSIGAYAFYLNATLTEIHIPASLTSVGTSAFSGCPALRAVYCAGDAADLSKINIGSSNEMLENAKHYFTSGECGDTLTWSLDDAGVLTVAGPGAMPDWETNAETGISSSPFAGDMRITQVVIGDGVTSIGADAFHGCTEITDVTLPASLDGIGVCAFRDCAALTEITVPDNTASLGDNVFNGCAALTAVTLPASLERVGDSAFSGCTALREVYYGGTESNWQDDLLIGEHNENLTGALLRFSGGKLGDDLTWTLYGGTLTVSGTGAMPDWEYQDDYPYCSSPFASDRRIEQVVIDDGVTSVGANAFFGCASLTGVLLADTVDSIGDYAFIDCGALSVIRMPCEMSAIGKYAFAKCWSLSSITIPGGVTGIGSHVFFLCDSLAEITIPETVSTVGDSAFESCNALRDVFYGGSESDWTELISGIGSRNDRLAGATVHCTGGSIGDLIYTLDADGTLTIVGSGPMPNWEWNTSANRSTSPFARDLRIKKLVIGDGVTSIGEEAFDGCTALQAARLPASLTAIGKSAFESCSALAEVYYAGSEDDWSVLELNTGSENENLTAARRYYGRGVCGDNLFYSLSDDGVLTVTGSGPMTDWSGMTQYPYSTSPFAWNDKIKKIVIVDGVESVGAYAFTQCPALTSVTMPDGLTNVGEFAFSACDAMTDVYYAGTPTAWGLIGIGDDNEDLTDAARHYGGKCGDNVFWTLDEEGTLTITGEGPMYDRTWYVNGDNVESTSPFSDNSDIKNVVIGNGVTSIGDYAFFECEALTAISIPDGVTGVGEGAFYGCAALGEIDLPASVTALGETVFAECSALKKITLPDGLKSIAENAFGLCTALEGITLPGYH